MGSDNNGVRIPASVATILDPVLATRPDATAIEAASGAWTYAELDAAAARAAGALWHLGVRPGDRVAACLPNDLPIVAAFHGAQRIGAVWAGIGEASAASEQQLLCDLVEPSVVLAGPRFDARVARAVDPDRWAGLLRTTDPAPRVETDPDAPAGIAFTSGTSGVPKAVVHSQRGMLLPGAVTVATRSWGPDLRRGDSFALTILNMMILSTLTTAQAGGTAVIMNRRDAEGVAEWIAAHRVTVWNGAPAQLYDLARRSADLSSLREVWSGGSDTSDAVRDAFAEAHGLVPRVTYGLTEAPTVVSIDPPGSAWRPGTSGRVTPQFDVAAYDDEGRRLPAGESGELRLAPAAAGPWAGRWTPMLGYWSDGRVRPGEPPPLPTGDIGTVDERGWLRVIDRKKLVIIRGGANVYPLEVERVITGHPGVAAAAVCGIPDERLGQRVAAVVESSGPALDFDALTAWCRRELASYKVPECWVRVPALPVNAMGKIQRTELAALVTAGLGEPS
ncbi:MULTISPECIES: class I adenylate-forming enzyme family protein [Nocardia]|uniref:class I adenylate-forming enzyme family protein n=1 Tax=Nocardia TaxID=1817 RepID=UPI0007E936A1|nr:MULTISPECIES: class I adenylate-forming enzyme family protein [Nocardia]OBA41306.1 AMP-dependent synthetase [Nocardia sp. 852002-51101_SCH5132738]OBB42070.1 AMP-dependent synthetase [Nocardia sp. 852002-51244_SCH5132740]OBF63702.1 AMP-dependent synthetase [Mycobacterium sp. 852002-51759_SCH5129042]